jgi:hypothetical protein
VSIEGVLRRPAAASQGALGRAPFFLAFVAGALATLYGIATGRVSMAAGIFLTSTLSMLYLAKPETALQLFAFYWPFHEILYLFAEGERIVLWADSTLVVFALLWMSRALSRKEPLLPRCGITWAILAFLGVLLLGLVRAPNVLAGLLGFKWWAMHIPLFFLTARTRLDGRRVFTLVLSLVLACAIKGFFHAGQLKIGGTFFPSSFPVGGEGAEAHSAYVCLYALVMIMGWAMAPYARTSRNGLLLLCGMLFTLLVVGLSLLRVAWIVIGIGTVVVILVARDLPIKRTAALLCALILMWMLGPDAWRQRIMVTFHYRTEASGSANGYSAAVKARTISWYVNRHLSGEASNALEDQSIWGGGLGTVTSNDAKKWIGDYANSVSAPESTLADAFIELGWLGLLAYFSIQLCLIWEAFRLTRTLRDARLRAFAAGICGCAVATLVADVGTEFSYAASTYYWYLAGLLLALRHTAGLSASPATAARGRKRRREARTEAMVAGQG